MAYLASLKQLSQTLYRDHPVASALGLRILAEIYRCARELWPEAGSVACLASVQMVLMHDVLGGGLAGFLKVWAIMR